MKKLLLAAIVTALASTAQAQPAQSDAGVEIGRIDCGRSDGPRDVSPFSDTHSLDGVEIPLVASCYLIRHGDEYLLWDTGYAVDQARQEGSGLVMDKSIVEQLAAAKLTPADIDMVGISHYHGDHIGQARDFPGATLLIGEGDWNALTQAAKAGDAEQSIGAPDPAPLAHWLSGGGETKTVARDHDIFGDGSIVMLSTPGHTPGHNALLVNLASGPVLLTGDTAHFTSNYDNNVVPSFNTDRADTLASLQRFKDIAANLDAVVIIQHEPDDVDKLPAVPAMAK